MFVSLPGLACVEFWRHMGKLCSMSPNPERAFYQNKVSCDTSPPTEKGSTVFQKIREVLRSQCLEGGRILQQQWTTVSLLFSSSAKDRWLVTMTLHLHSNFHLNRFQSSSQSSDSVICLQTEMALFITEMLPALSWNTAVVQCCCVV